MGELAALTAEFRKWNGYCEKDSSKQLGESMKNPESYTTNAGDGNFTIFAKDFAKWTGINVQGQAWCDTFIDSVFIYILGIDRAKKLLGGFSAYTPTSANYFKKMNRYYLSPRAGDIIFFRNSERIYHTGFVYEVTDGIVKTIEGNTSTSAGVVPNGGQVAMKSYSISTSKIDGYGRPDYNDTITTPPSGEGWHSVADPTTNKKKWIYVKDDGLCCRNKLAECNGLRYYFDENGYMVTGQIFINGERHVFSENGFEGAELLINNTVGFKEV